MVKLLKLIRLKIKLVINLIIYENSRFWLLLKCIGAQYDKSSPGWKALSRVACLCNRAEFKNRQQGLPVMQRGINGDASEAALLKCIELATGEAMAIRSRNSKVCKVPFKSSNK